MSSPCPDTFATRGSLAVGDRSYDIFRLGRLEELGLTELDRLPFSIRILLENVLRNEDGKLVTEEHVRRLAAYDARNVPNQEIPYLPARVVLQDFTGVPAVVDLAALRDAVALLGGDPRAINPLVPVDLVIDHSVIVDRFASPAAFAFNVGKEFERNRERYLLLKWAQQSFHNFRVVPPGTGIVHQVNLEYLATVVATASRDGTATAYPDTLVGTDSHTTMINGLGVMGWGVGGIEAEAVMLGQPYYMLMPEVVGFKLTGALPEGASATDLVLTVTQILRSHGVVGKFVEFYGPGLDALSVADRATIANMAPEYGATMGFFPVDRSSLDYLELTGRSPEVVERAEAYLREQHLFRTADTPDPTYTETLELDMHGVEPCLAGPKRPQDRVQLSAMKAGFQGALAAAPEKRGFGLAAAETGRSVSVRKDGETFELRHGSVVIAAITSCTNTSNPSVMLAAGLVARKAMERGIRSKPWVKTSLAPGSRVVTDYLARAGLLESLEAQGFHLVGYGCTTCIGNSGPLPDEISTAITEGDLVAASVLSGNRNFEGRIHPLVKANYLASPPLVIAYALAGRVDIALETEPLGIDPQGNPVLLRDIWPTQQEIASATAASLTPAMFRDRYAAVFEGDEAWSALPAEPSKTFPWDPASTYIKAPPFFDDMPREAVPPGDIRSARVLAVLGDSVTTDHISPAGAIPRDGPAGTYLIDHGVRPADFNSFGSRRGNHEVMMRGTFANIRLKNRLAPGTEGGWTVHLPDGEAMSIFEAALRYRREGTPLVVLAGTEYGTGSSRDWAAKGTALLGVRAVIARSYERIHRSNLLGMGVLPLQFREGEDRETLGLTGTERVTITGVAGNLTPGSALEVTARDENGGEKRFTVRSRLDTPIEVEYFLNGGILHTVLRGLLAAVR
jgi:aconitate hydratase